MGLINPSRGVIDLNDFRALQPLFDAAREVGLWVVLRPGMHLVYMRRVSLFIRPSLGPVSCLRHSS